MDSWPPPDLRACVQSHIHGSSSCLQRIESSLLYWPCKWSMWLVSSLWHCGEPLTVEPSTVVCVSKHLDTSGFYPMSLISSLQQSFNNFTVGVLGTPSGAGWVFKPALRGGERPRLGPHTDLHLVPAVQVEDDWRVHFCHVMRLLMKTVSLQADSCTFSCTPAVQHFKNDLWHRAVSSLRHSFKIKSHLCRNSGARLDLLFCVEDFYPCWVRHGHDVGDLWGLNTNITTSQSL